ncbi:MAG: hypothetical protein JST71_00015 [Bacteroidetes bacterium]|nr:hypothetical protein [Bacteroidota bacterium]MBX7239704.1 hypothetical protein [Bacteroidia bacterium]MCC7515117.1 hypothetical protein [Bacteroidia bacterium]MCW5919067.1 hypothetical protein [Bacteroidota bacterium]HCI57260.1 hypothetical protein [Bacteroidota bacterium]
MNNILKILFIVAISTNLSSCKKKEVEVYYRLKFCDTCLTIGGAIEYEKQNNSIELPPMPEEEFYQSIYHKFDPEYSIRLNKGTHEKHIYAFKNFLDVDTIFKLKILKAYIYPFELKEDSLLNRLFLEEIRIKIFNTDSVIDSLYDLPRFTECKYDSLKLFLISLKKSMISILKKSMVNQKGNEFFLMKGRQIFKIIRSLVI